MVGPKPGMKTSEFYVAAIMPGLITILNQIFGWGIDWQSLIGMFVPSSAYAISRGMAK